MSAARAVKSVDRRSKLSCNDFFEQYAEKSKPVIITDILSECIKTPVYVLSCTAMTSLLSSLSLLKCILHLYKLTNYRTWESIKEDIGKIPVEMKQEVSQSTHWARLEDVLLLKPQTLDEFIDLMQTHSKSKRHLKDWKPMNRYIHDWSIPLFCPHSNLLANYRIPKYFSGDYLQKCNPGSLYRETWPSLFVGPSGTRSALHIDGFFSNFWMALFEGRKRWVFFTPDDLPLLYPDYIWSETMDPVFEVDLRTPSMSKDECKEKHMKNFPLFQFAQPFECVLEPGEILFVPAGCPHFVENMEDTLAISSNYVDHSNVSGTLKVLKDMSLLNEQAGELLHQLDVFSSKRPHIEQENVPWKEFKCSTKEPQRKRRKL